MLEGFVGVSYLPLKYVNVLSRLNIFVENVRALDVNFAFFRKELLPLSAYIFGVPPQKKNQLSVPRKDQSRNTTLVRIKVTETCWKSVLLGVVSFSLCHYTTYLNACCCF